ncbi:MAG: LacI family transcriptional regulator, partial [Ruminococcaceae bacterium]|nr:LacI family transcriptional regulator [Oscillospiraceae bacterium]
MKKIAIFVSHWSEEQAKYFLEGAKRRTLEGGVRVSMFSSYGDFDGDKPVNFGEYNVFYLPDLSLFDGAIVVANSIYDKTVLDNLVSHINAYGVPLILADYDTGDDKAYFVGVDNYDGISQIVEHLIIKHHCKKLHYVSGPDKDRENIERLQAFEDTTEKYGIPKENTDVIHGMYQFADGLSTGAKYVSGQLELPDAVVCANDLMAAGVCDVLLDNGVRIPDDVIVTGFDNYEFSQHYKIKFTTFDRPKEDLGYICLDRILKLTNGEKSERQTKIRGRLVLSESCGCNEEQYENNLDYIRRIYITNVTGNNTYSSTKELTDTLLSAKDFETMLVALSNFSSTYFSNPPLLVIDDGFYKSMFRSSEDKRLMRGYSDKSHLFYYSEASEKLCEISFSTRELIPEKMQKQKENIFNFFMPLHFQGKCMGYIVAD